MPMRTIRQITISGMLVLFYLLAAGVVSAGVWKFAVMGDTRGDDTNATPQNPWINAPVIQAIAAQIVSNNPNFVIVIGDLIYNWTSGDYGHETPPIEFQYRQWTNAMSAVYQAGIPVYVVRGNHETDRDQDGTNYIHFFGQNVPTNGPIGEKRLTYSFTYSNAFFIALDEYVNYPTVNQSWLTNQLAANRQPHVFVYGHMPAFKLADETALADDPTARDNFWSSIANGGCRMYFCGHDHLYNRAIAAVSNAPAVQQVLIGAGGAPFDGFSASNWPNSYPDPRVRGTSHWEHVYGYSIVTVDGDNVKYDHIATGTNLNAWQVYDHAEYTVNTPVSCDQPDYDGDGKADPVLYDETTGTWRVKLSSANYYQINTTLGGLGGPRAASVGADYDGDGLADPAVYYEQTGRWDVMLSSANYAVVVVLLQTLGGAGYSGMPADYDGDGKADPAVYQRERGDWKVMMSSANYNPVEVPGLLGGTGYSAVAADYDGDRLADPAIYGENNGYWIFKLSSANYITIVLTQTLGGTGYIPVPADYDGDGLADPAVMSQTSNEWIVMLSSADYTPINVTLQFE